MGLFRAYFRSDMDELVERNVRMRIIGHRGRVARRHPADDPAMSESRTAKNDGMNLTFAFDYGGQEEIAAAAQELARAAKDGRLDPETITPDLFAARLFTSALPAPDLVIRTSGEHRLSNFLLWQSAYAELLFLDTLWPDFDRAALTAALNRVRGARTPLRRAGFGSRGVTVSQQPPRRDHPLRGRRAAGAVRRVPGASRPVRRFRRWPELFAAITVLMTLFAAREWHRMVAWPAKAAEARSAALSRPAIISGGTTTCALTAVVLRAGAGCASPVRRSAQSLPASGRTAMTTIRSGMRLGLRLYRASRLSPWW